MDKLELAEQIAVLSGCLYLSWKIVKYVWSFLDVEEDPVTVLVTGAAGMFAHTKQCVHCSIAQLSSKCFWVLPIFFNFFDKLVLAQAK